MRKFSRNLCGATIAISTIATAAPSQAGDIGAGIIGGVIGGIVGGAITNSANRNRQQERVHTREVIRERTVPRTVYKKTPRIDPYTRQQNRTTQTALNYFGFNAGAPDGVLGRRSRAAISAFQGYMNFPITGYLTPQEQAFLTASHSRALAGGATTMQIAAASPYGVRAVLPQYWSGQTVAVAPAPVVVAPAPVVVAPAPQVVAAAPQQQPQNQITINVPQAQAPAAQPQQQQQQQPAQTQTVAAQPQQTAPAPAPAPAEAETQEVAAALPMFVTGPIEASMSSFCARTPAPSLTPGADVQNASLSVEGEGVLASQFCATRAQALVEADQIAATIQGVTRSDMQRQCEAFAPSMDAYVAKLVSEPAAATKSALQAYVVGTGYPMQALAANSRICLGIGYSADNARVTLASSLVLVGLGEIGVGEVLAYHLAYGFGAPENRLRAADWLEDAAGGVRAGAKPVVVNTATDRPALLAAMALRLRGAPSAAPQMQAIGEQPAATGGFVMPGADPAKKKL